MSKDYVKVLGWIFWIIFLFSILTDFPLLWKDLSVNEKGMDGTNYLINSTLKYRCCDFFVSDKVEWYFNGAEIWFEKNEAFIGNITHITPPDHIFASYCLDDADKCFTNIRLDKITESDLKVKYANNAKLFQEIKFMGSGNKNLVITTFYPKDMTLSKQTFTSFKGSKLKVQEPD